ncbi:TPR end-of-group domain-containing protein [Ekhidna sp.]
MRKLIYSLIILVTNLSFGQSLRELYQEGLKAYEEKEYALFQEKMYSIDTMRPNYPAVVYNLAGSYALIGDKEKSLETLHKYVLMDATQDFTKDSDFQSIVNLEEFKDIIQKQSLLKEEKTIDVAYKIPLLQIHPESISYSKKQKSIFIGGAHDGNIWEIQQDNAPKLWAESPKNSWSIMGLEVSQDEKILWVCTSSMNNFQGYNQNEEGYASVLKYDLRSGKLLETFALPGGHNFGDLISDSQGNVYISDGTANKIYWIDKESGELEVFIDMSETVFNLQGLTFGKGERSIYASDYIDGIYEVSLNTKEIVKVKIEANDVLIKGIDGLYFYKNSLIGLHNGTKPNRVVQYELSENGDSIINKIILAQAGALGEPTQGTWVEGVFHYIVNSPWAAYDRDGSFNPQEEHIIIGKIE